MRAIRRRIILPIGLAMLCATGSRALAQCMGDCDESGDVSVGEVVKVVNVALGALRLSICAGVDPNSDRRVGIDEAILAVKNSLRGCPPTPTPTSTPTATASATPTETATPSPTETPTDTATPTQTATPSPTETPTGTATPTDTDTPTETPTQTSTADAATPTATLEATPTATVCEPLAGTFEGIQREIFERRGCTQAICHGSSPGQGSLELSPEVAYRNLIDVPSTEVSLSRVTPGGRDRSYLFLKLAAATQPSQLPSGFELFGSPMPLGSPPLSLDELRAVRLWVFNGAPENGTVPGTEGLLGGCLPPPLPITIPPLPPSAPGEGVQLVLPPWPLPAGTEIEGCFATYYDFSEQTPIEFRDPSGELFAWGASETREDPLADHLLLYLSPLNFLPGGIDVNHPSFGTWKCFGGPLAGTECEPKDLGSCGDAGVCASTFNPSFNCVGYGPPAPQPAEIVGGSPKAQGYVEFPAGVFQWLPLKGVVYWSTHAVNPTTVDHTMHGRLNFSFTAGREHQATRIGDFSAIFRPNNPPFTRETFCRDHVFPIGSRVFLLFGHTRKHGEVFRVTDPNGTVVYENHDHADPVLQRYDPPLAFDSPNVAERTVRYCATFNNGVDANGTPDVELVTRASRVAPDAFIGRCNPVACVAGRVAAPCADDADCDSKPGAGDGWCDACAITGGASTENEMFVLFAAQYVDPTVPGGAIAVSPAE